MKMDKRVFPNSGEQKPGKPGKTGKQEKSGKNRDIYEWMQAMVCSVLAVVLLFTFVIRLIGVDGHSMVPTLQDGDRLLVLNSMLCGGYGPGDIVVLRKERFLPTPIVKRVIATGGQVVDIDFASGIVYVDGQKADVIDLVAADEVPRLGLGGIFKRFLNTLFLQEH